MSEFIAKDPGTQSGIEAVDAILEGGPAHLPPELRTHRVARTKEKIKVCFYGGYEHFERDPDAATDSRQVVFRWTNRTRIAE